MSVSWHLMTSFINCTLMTSFIIRFDICTMLCLNVRNLIKVQCFTTAHAPALTTRMHPKPELHKCH